MIAYSRVPDPFEQQQQKLFEIPLKKTFQIESIPQAKKAKPLVHIIRNPNQAIQTYPTFGINRQKIPQLIGQESSNALANEIQSIKKDMNQAIDDNKNVKQEEKRDLKLNLSEAKNRVVIEVGTQQDRIKEQSRGFFFCQDLDLQEDHQQQELSASRKRIAPQSSPIKELELSNNQNTSLLQQQSLPINPTFNIQQFSEISHIIFSPPAIQPPFGLNQSSFHKRKPPIFPKELVLNTEERNKFKNFIVESVVKEEENIEKNEEQVKKNEEMEGFRGQSDREAVGGMIVERLDGFVASRNTAKMQEINLLVGENEPESHIECSFFGNTTHHEERNSHSKNFRQTGYGLGDRQNYQNPNRGQQAPKSRQMIQSHIWRPIGQLQKPQHNSYDNQNLHESMYESYYLNRSKIKKLGGRRGSLVGGFSSKRRCKQVVKLQLIKLVRIQPVVF